MKLPKVNDMNQYTDKQLVLLQTRIEKIKEKRKTETKSKQTKAKKAVSNLQAKYGTEKIKAIAGALK